MVRVSSLNVVLQRQGLPTLYICIVLLYDEGGPPTVTYQVYCSVRAEYAVAESRPLSGLSASSKAQCRMQSEQLYFMIRRRFLPQI